MSLSVIPRTTFATEEVFRALEDNLCAEGNLDESR